MIKINGYNLKKIQDTLNNIHPKQLINEVGSVSFGLYQVKYKYTTNRGNRREGEKYFLLKEIHPQVNMEEKLEKWVLDYNNENKHRQISNVEFLDSRYLGFLDL